MAGLLEILLDTRSTRRAQARDTLREAYELSRVTAIGPKGIQFSKPDTRASTAYAQRNAQMILGYVPNEMKTRASLETTIPFKKGSDTYERLTKAGIKKGSSLSELHEFLNSEQSSSNLKRSGDKNNEMNAQNLFAMEQTGPGMNGSVTPQNRSQTNMVAGHLSGYSNGQNENNQSFLQLQTEVNSQHDNFMQLLHSSLFNN